MILAVANASCGTQLSSNISEDFYCVQHRVWNSLSQAYALNNKHE